MGLTNGVVPDQGTAEESGAQSQQVARPQKQARWTEFSCLLALMAPGTWLLLWVSEALGRLWRPLGIFSYLMVALFAVALLFAVRAESKVRVKSDTTALALGNGLVLIICYSQIMRHLYIGFGGFQATDASYWTWLRYNLINVSLGILRNIPATYDWVVRAPIVPTALWSQTAMFLFTTLADGLLTVVLWRALVDMVKGLRLTFHSRSYRTYGRLVIGGGGQFLLAAIWLLPLSFLVDGLFQGAITVHTWWSAVKVLVPMLLAGLVVWKSAQGLIVLPQWQRLWAVGGACVAAWYLYSHWWLWGSLAAK